MVAAWRKSLEKKVVFYFIFITTVLGLIQLLKLYPDIKNELGFSIILFAYVIFGLASAFIVPKHLMECSKEGVE